MPDSLLFDWLKKNLEPILLKNFCPRKKDQNSHTLQYLMAPYIISSNFQWKWSLQMK